MKFFAYTASELCSSITWCYIPAFNSSRVRKSEVLEMTLNCKKELFRQCTITSKATIDTGPLNLVVCLSSRDNLLLQQRCKNSLKKRLQSNPMIGKVSFCGCGTDSCSAMSEVYIPVLEAWGIRESLQRNHLETKCLKEYLYCQHFY